MARIAGLPVNARWMRENLVHDTRDDLVVIHALDEIHRLVPGSTEVHRLPDLTHVPVLAVTGAKDIQVDPAGAYGRGQAPGDRAGLPAEGFLARACVAGQQHRRPHLVARGQRVGVGPKTRQALPKPSPELGPEPKPGSGRAGAPPVTSVACRPLCAAATDRCHNRSTDLCGHRQRFTPKSVAMPTRPEA
ncbi:hypothetical protein [Streptomyces hebeiensis]